MDNVNEISTPSSLSTQSVKPCGLMDLSVEIRTKILGHLLPNALEIETINRVMHPPTYRRYEEPCHTAILRVNHQLYADGTALLYNRSFQVKMTDVCS